MTRFPVPVVVVSNCLGFAACRYDGQVVEDGFVATLGRHARLVTVCPEVEIGLGVPRDKIRLVGTGAGQRLVQPGTGRDLWPRPICDCALWWGNRRRLTGGILAKWPSVKPCGP